MGKGRKSSKKQASTVIDLTEVKSDLTTVKSDLTEIKTETPTKVAVKTEDFINIVVDGQLFVVYPMFKGIIERLVKTHFAKFKFNPTDGMPISSAMFCERFGPYFTNILRFTRIALSNYTDNNKSGIIIVVQRKIANLELGTEIAPDSPLFAVVEPNHFGYYFTDEQVSAIMANEETYFFNRNIESFVLCVKSNSHVKGGFIAFMIVDNDKKGKIKPVDYGKLIPIAKTVSLPATPAPKVVVAKPVFQFKTPAEYVAHVLQGFQKEAGYDDDDYALIENIIDFCKFKGMLVICFGGLIMNVKARNDDITYSNCRAQDGRECQNFNCYICKSDLGKKFKFLSTKNEEPFIYVKPIFILLADIWGNKSKYASMGVDPEFLHAATFEAMWYLKKEYLPHICVANKSDK